MAMALSETPIREALVTAAGPWREVLCPGEIDSTNAASLADPRPWRVLTSRHQTSGRGRHSRAWSSPPGASVALSLTVPMAPDAGRWGWLPLVTGVAVVDALGLVTGAPDRFALKWPNDVLARDVGGRWGKLCGILCELAPARSGAGADPLVVAGVGINVALSRAELPVPTATSLTLAGFDRPGEGDLVVAVARAFADWHDAWYAGPADAVQAAYRSRCDTLGRDVEVHLPDSSTVRGRAVDIARGGELVVEVATANGGSERREFASGDVIHVRPSGAPGPIGQE